VDLKVALTSRAGGFYVIIVKQYGDRAMGNHKLFAKSSTNMSDLEDNSVQLIIFSPPYGNLVRDYGDKTEDISSSSFQVWYEGMGRVVGECKKVLQEGRVMAINIANVLEGQVGHQTNYVRHISNVVEGEVSGFYLFRDIIWRKPMGAFNVNISGHWIKKEEQPMSLHPHPLTEHILLYKKEGKYEPPERQEWDRNYYRSRHLTPVQQAMYGVGNFQDEIRKDSWYFNTTPSRLKEHPAVFPIELPIRIIRLYSYEGETVLDPFSGSGTTMEAAAQLLRNGYGYEIYPKYIEVIKSKMSKYCGLLDTFEVVR
jgi:DNA modification methylase